MQLNDRYRTFAEGPFCDDSAGCRRRALHIKRELESTVIELHGRLETFEKFEDPTTEPDEPAHR
jgi:hypothetical protein